MNNKLINKVAFNIVSNDISNDNVVNYCKMLNKVLNKYLPLFEFRVWSITLGNNRFGVYAQGESSFYPAYANFEMLNGKMSYDYGNESPYLKKSVKINFTDNEKNVKHALISLVKGFKKQIGKPIHVVLFDFYQKHKTKPLDVSEIWKPIKTKKYRTN